MNAKKKDAKHIPHFLEFERWGMRACIKFEINATRLRDVIGNRSVMEMEGQKIIRNLLLGLKEVRKHKLVVRDIQPKYIAMSEDYAALQFCGLANI